VIIRMVCMVCVLAEQLQQGAELDDDEQLVLERWLDEAKFSRVLKPSTHREAIQRVLCHYVFDSRMSQLQAIAVSVIDCLKNCLQIVTNSYTFWQAT